MPPSPAAVRAMFRAFLRTGTSSVFRGVRSEIEKEGGSEACERERVDNNLFQIEVQPRRRSGAALSKGLPRLTGKITRPFFSTPPQAPTSPTTTSASTYAAAPGSASARQRPKLRRRRRGRQQQEKEQQRARRRPLRPTPPSRRASGSLRPRGGRRRWRGFTTGRSGR